MKHLSAFAVPLLLVLGMLLLGGCRDKAKDTMTEIVPAAEENTMTLTIGNTPVDVDWEDNEAVRELKKLAAEKPLTISLSMYGGFEQVGAIGRSLPRRDVRITTQSGDIVLYSGDQIVVFYGSNTWSYTKLGHIKDKSSAEMRELLSNGDVSITLAVN